jgi:GNAT superfamily N-acetyltransferase
LTFTIYNKENPIKEEQKHDFTQFLFTHLGKYGDSKEAIGKCIDYVFNKGGFIITSEIDQKIVSVAIINDTGMGGYIPEHILVYIATDSKMRGKGLGSKLLQEIINTCDGDLALHVEPENPAAKLYRRFGFTNKYLEMRRVKKKG